MIDRPDDGVSAPPLTSDRLALLCHELARPLAAARTKLAAHQARHPDDRAADGALHGATEAAKLVDVVVGLCAGITRAPDRVETDLGAMVAEALALAPRYGSDSRIALALPRPVVGRWSHWLCRRLVRELLSFPIAISDRQPVVAADRATDSAVVSIHLTGADLRSEEAETLRRELGPSPHQLHLWLAARLAELHGGGLRVSTSDQGWVGLTLTLPDHDPHGGTGRTRPPIVVSSEQRRGLIHLLRSPISAARLRLPPADQWATTEPIFPAVERDLLAADGAIARLIPVTGGQAALDPAPGDLSALVAQAIRAAVPAGTLKAGRLDGNWDAFAVDCIVRNLTAASGGGPAQPARFALKAAPSGATISVASTTDDPPPDEPRRWLIQQLALAHGGWSSFASRPGSLAAEVFLRSGELT